MRAEIGGIVICEEDLRLSVSEDCRLAIILSNGIFVVCLDKAKFGSNASF